MPSCCSISLECVSLALLPRHKALSPMTVERAAAHHMPQPSARPVCRTSPRMRRFGHHSCITFFPPACRLWATSAPRRLLKLWLTTPAL